MKTTYDALMLVSFGGPEGPDDVMPFLENVLRGRNVPRERMLLVAEHYNEFGGVSPINENNRRLISLLEKELAEHQMSLPIYFGNRNWHPMLAETLEHMKDEGVKRALAIVTSGYGSYSSCRQYRENLEEARERVGEGAPEVDKLRLFFNHPGFLESMVACTRRAIMQLQEDRRDECQVLFTAHSIPVSMAAGCQYAVQLEETSRLVAAEIGIENWRLVYQSRSGSPHHPWLGPDILEEIRLSAEAGVSDVVVVPVGFISTHMEILYDLDIEAHALCQQLGLTMVRAEAVAQEPRFVSMLRELIEERLRGDSPLAVGGLEAPPHVCVVDCCPIGVSGGRPG